MVVDISRAWQSPGTEFPFQVSQEIPTQDILGENVVFDKAAISGFFTAAGDSIVLQGQLTSKANAVCANCLAPAEVDIQVLFREIFVREVEDDDSDSFLFEGNHVDVSQVALALAILALPMRFLCKEDCEGYCPNCGAEKNLCTCQKELPSEHPFAALQQLLSKDEEV